MSFLSPAFLLALPLIGIPVLIHLFGKRQRDVVKWGAMEFLMRSAVPRRRFLRLRDLLLMLLRMAVVLAIVAALAQPMVSSQHLGNFGPRDVILVIDNSMSTGRKASGGTVFHQEINEAATFLGRLTPSDMIRVMVTSPRPEWFTDTTLAADSGNIRELIHRLRDLEPTEAAADMPECLQEAIKAEPAGKQMPRSVVVISDTQARSWRADAAGSWAALHTLATKAVPPVFVSSILVGNESAANICVEKISAARPIVAALQPAILTASVKNTGSEPSAPTTLAWTADGQALGVSPVPALPAGAATTVSISQPFSAPGLVDISARIAAEDDLAADDSARFLLEVAKSAPVLVVQGATPSDPMESDIAYFLATLGISDAESDSNSVALFQPKAIGYARLGQEDLAAYRCVVLADVPRLPADVTQRLAEYVAAGGGLWIAPGDQTDANAFNRMFYEQSTGLSPLPLLPAVGDADDREKFTGLVPPAPDHPATALLADIQRLDLDKVRVYRRFPFDTSRGAASVLLRLEGGEPLAVEKSIGRGRVIVQSIPLGVSWSSFPLCQSYVVMANEWLWYLTEPGLAKRNLKAGEGIELLRPADSTVESCSLQLPDGRTVRVLGDDEGGRTVFRHAKTSLPGEYVATLAGDGARTEKFLVNRDVTESDLTPLADAQKKMLGTIGGLAIGGDPLAQTSESRLSVTPPKPIAHWLLAALVALLAAEAAAAFWLARQRRVKAAPVVMQPGLST
jgi:hypothetical protein